jgi:AcrR family transcriptional regulator
MSNRSVEPRRPAATSGGKPRRRSSSSETRKRILDTAYDLFCRHGVHAIGVDRIAAEAGVAKMSLYRNFGSKADLALAVLERRAELFTRDWLEHEVEARATTGEARLLAVFDLWDEWFRRRDYEACLFINTMLESHDRKSRVAAASVAELVTIRSLLQRWAREAGVRDSAALAQQLQILMAGSIVFAAAGDRDSARRARDVAELLLARELGALGDQAAAQR